MMWRLTDGIPGLATLALQYTREDSVKVTYPLFLIATLAMQAFTQSLYDSRYEMIQQDHSFANGAR